MYQAKNWESVLSSSFQSIFEAETSCQLQEFPQATPKPGISPCCVLFFCSLYRFCFHKVLKENKSFRLQGLGYQFSVKVSQLCLSYCTKFQVGAAYNEEAAGVETLLSWSSEETFR